ncbi:MAG: hypothetical protein ACYTXC_21995 [Nostoc sp.]
MLRNVELIKMTGSKGFSPYYKPFMLVELLLPNFRIIHGKLLEYPRSHSRVP